MRPTLVFFLVWTAWAALHSLTMSRAVKGWLAGRLGRHFALYRLGFTALSLASFAAAVALTPRLTRELWVLHGPAAFGVWTLRLAALGFFIWSFVHFDLMEFLGLRQALRRGLDRLDPDGETERAAHLSAAGPFKLVRHPLYLSSSLLLFLDPSMTLEKLLFALFATGYFLVGSVFEERRLVAAFGESYRAYQRATPRFLPWRLLRGQRS